MSGIEDVLKHELDGNNDSYEEKWNDFILFSVIHLLKAIVGKVDNPNAAFMSLIKQWKARQDTGFEKEIKEFSEKLDDKTDLINMLFGSMIPSVDDLRKKHKETMDKVVMEIEATFIKPEA